MQGAIQVLCYTFTFVNGHTQLYKNVSSDNSPVVVQLLVQRLPVVNYGHILTRQPQTRVIGYIPAPGLFDLTLESSLIAFPNPTEGVRRRPRNQYSDWTTADKDYA